MNQKRRLSASVDADLIAAAEQLTSDPDDLAPLAAAAGLHVELVPV